MILSLHGHGSRRSSRRHSRSERGVGDRAREGSGYRSGACGRPCEGVGRSSRLIDQLALTFEELGASATEDELAAERAVARTTTVRGFTRTHPVRNTFPDHLPRERVVIDPTTQCECYGAHPLPSLRQDLTP